MTTDLSPAPAPRRDVATLVLFTAMVALLHADQNLMAPSLTAIGTEFGFSRAEIDQRLGADVNLTFWMLGGVVTLLIGYLTDRADLAARLSRKWLLVAVAFVGQLACLLSGFASSYGELHLLRALTGIGVGGAFPLVFSLVGDLFPVERRAAANATVGLAMGLGIAAGQQLAGSFGPVLGWRAPFILVAVPGLLLNLAFAWVAREPRRGQHEAALRDFLAEGHSYSERLRLADLPDLLRVRTNLVLLLQALPGTVPWGVFFVYLNDFYAHDKGFSVQVATLLVMAIGVAALVGAFLGGLLGQRLFNRHPRYLPLLCALTTAGAVLPTALVISYPVRPGAGLLGLIGPIAAGFASGLLAACTGPNVNTMLINVNPPERRGAAFALLNLFNDLGRGLGAWVVGSLAATLGRVSAFHIANLLWLVCGAALLSLVWLFPREQAAMQARLRELATRPRRL
ncbi:MAG: MFS transporter [Polyangia bacterium]